MGEYIEAWEMILQMGASSRIIAFIQEICTLLLREKRNK